MMQLQMKLDAHTRYADLQRKKGLIQQKVHIITRYHKPWKLPESSIKM